MANDGAKEKEHEQIIALKEGSPAAWRELLACYGPSLLAYATRMLGNKAIAEEILQDSLVNIYKTIDRFDGRCSIKSWMYRAVRNRSIDEIRRQKRYVEIGDDPEKDYFNSLGEWQENTRGWDGYAAQKLDHKNLLSYVHKEMNKLPHAQREILLLKEVEGLETKEICAALEISAENMRIRLHRARAALRASVNDKMKERNKT